MRVYSTLFFFALLLMSCEPCNKNCQNMMPPPNYFELNLVDSAGSCMIGSVYMQDSLRLYNSTTDIYLHPTACGDPRHVRICYPDIQSTAVYYLELDSNDTDTLTMMYNCQSTKCGQEYTMGSCMYNGHQISSDNNIYNVLK